MVPPSAYQTVLNEKPLDSCLHVHNTSGARRAAKARGVGSEDTAMGRGNSEDVGDGRDCPWLQGLPFALKAPLPN